MRRHFFLACFFSCVALVASAQQPTYLLSSHILDITRGLPAGDVKISLSKLERGGDWKLIDERNTDSNGRVKDFLMQKKGQSLDGIYKLTFHTAPYFKRLNQESFYPFIEVVFQIKGGSHYHVPITLSPFGYSTYRGN